MTKTKNSLGQNFLRDKKILKKIVDFARIEKTDTVVEVGPGEGTLTELLLERAEKVIAIEKDEKLAKLLENKFHKQIIDNRLQIIEEDILNYNLKSNDYKLIGNIPYYITGALFKKVLESENPPKSLTFVVQKEVAERIVAKNKKESILSISIKVYGEPEFGGVIKAGSFYPKPKVDSAIIAVRGINKDRFDNLTSSSLKASQSLNGPGPSPRSRRGEEDIEKKFFEILKAGFAHKRKLLSKNLKDVSRFNLDNLREIFKKCGIAEKARAEDLSVEDWVCLTRELM